MFPVWATRPFEEYRTRRMAQYLLPHIGFGESVLDCGCGSMLIAALLSEHAAATVYGTDVINLNRTALSMCLSAGERLPFASNSMDTICLVFVLHHVRSPGDTLRECLRVTRRRVIVAEDVYENPLELGVLRALDWFGNRSVSGEMELPFGFETEPAWGAIFQELGMTIAAVERIRPIPWRPSRHRLFVLEKPGRHATQAELGDSPGEKGA